MEKIKMSAQGIDHKQDIYDSTFVAVRGIYILRQQQNESLDSYHRRFKAAMNTADFLKANTTSYVGMMDFEEQGTRTDTQLLSDCKEGYKATIVLMNADHRIYNKLWMRLSAFEILSKCKPETSNRAYIGQFSTESPCRSYIRSDHRHAHVHANIV